MRLSDFKNVTICHPSETRDPTNKPSICHPGESRDPDKKATVITITFNSSHITNIQIKPGNTTVILDPRFRGDDDKGCGNDWKRNTDSILEYFSNPKHKFTLAINPQGTDFQKRVWKALQEIPSGQTLTYGELAKKLNSHPRAIGQACRKNPIPIIIPCHRVVGKNDLGGYSGEQEGDLMNFKKQLLKHEGAIS